MRFCFQLILYSLVSHVYDVLVRWLTQRVRLFCCSSTEFGDGVGNEACPSPQTTRICCHELDLFLYKRSHYDTPLMDTLLGWLQGVKAVFVYLGWRGVALHQ